MSYLRQIIDFFLDASIFRHFPGCREIIEYTLRTMRKYKTTKGNYIFKLVSSWTLYNWNVIEIFESSAKVLSFLPKLIQVLIFFIYELFTPYYKRVMEFHHNKFITLKSSLLYSVGLGTVLGVPSAPYLGKFLPQTMYNQYIDLYGFFDGSLLYQCFWGYTEQLGNRIFELQCLTWYVITNC